ncbi:MAG: hypothetical protein NPIRA01_13640 [Nitrospirales bacterium]|nr:MAG: hypothetical protein NPIRA01_13640 [Nitrospirales bacterium]
MYFSNTDIKKTLEDFLLENNMLTYDSFVGRVYNFCRSLGFEPGKILPSRAFCSDENQGYPIILIAKHFGTFPFNHGRVGGTVSTDRHGPHAEHGKDLLIIHASHVGYDPSSRIFGTYHRRHTEDCEKTPSCGKIYDVLEWYLKQYTFAKDNIFLDRHGKDLRVTIDNQILNEDKTDGLFLNMEKIVGTQRPGEFRPIKSYSTSQCYSASQEFCELMGVATWSSHERRSIGNKLLPELFNFKWHSAGDSETHGLLEENLLRPMPWIVSSPYPLLTAAQANIQVEFDRSFRTLVNADGYHGKRVVFISCLNIDISPSEDILFPLTKTVPWAAFIQHENGSSVVLEQQDLMNRLLEQSQDNPDEVDLEHEIQNMKDTQEIKIAKV